MLDLARNGGQGEPVSLAAVAGRTDLSRGYLEQLALTLRHASLVKGVSGRKGGYRLAAPATEITVAQVIEAAIGPIVLVDCLEDPASCPRSESCECRVVYRIINRRVVEVLEEYSLADLLDPSWVRSHVEPGQDMPALLDQDGGVGCGFRPRRAEIEKKGTH